MKIGVISDTHGSLTAWQQAYSYLKDTELIIHCGDLLYHGPRNPLPQGYAPKELATALNEISIPLLIARGNCDAEVDQLLINEPIEAPYVRLYLPRLQIFVHHGDQPLPQKIENNYQLIISGHTHLAGINQVNSLIYLNPGSPALPKNETQTKTIALIDEDFIKIIELDTGTTLAQKNLAL